MDAIGQCPPEQRLAAFVEGQLPRDEFESVAQHVDQCAACFDAVAMLASLTEHAPPPVPVGLRTVALTQSSRAPVWHRRGPALTAAAALIIAAVWWQGGADHPATGRDAAPDAPISEGDVTRGTPSPAVILEEPVDGSSVRGGVHLRWMGPPEAVYYEVQLTTDAGDLIWSGRASGSTRDMIVDAALPAGRTLYVWVAAVLPQGRRISSNVVRVSVSPGA